jgi:hypothetical protein
MGEQQGEFCLLVVERRSRSIYTYVISSKEVEEMDDRARHPDQLDTVAADDGRGRGCEVAP